MDRGELDLICSGEKIRRTATGSMEEVSKGGDFIEHRAYSRVGLLGNPSDVYFGRTLSFALANFWATVRLKPSERLVIEPNPHHDLVEFPSIECLVKRVQNEGYYGGVRLLMATCKMFYNYCLDHKIDLQGGNFTLSYDTNIPRQTGLSGSSAIVCAALNCLLEFYGVRHLVKVEERPNLILSSEGELGITAGLQDRVAQVYGGLVYMDFSKEHMDKKGYGVYVPMDPDLLPQLHLIYAENPSDSGKIHSPVRQRWLDGDELIRSSMAEVAELALQGRDALLEKDYSKLAKLMNRNFDLRRFWKKSISLFLNFSSFLQLLGLNCAWHLHWTLSCIDFGFFFGISMRGFVLPTSGLPELTFRQNNDMGRTPF